MSIEVVVRFSRKAEGERAGADCLQIIIIASLGNGSLYSVIITRRLFCSLNIVHTMSTTNWRFESGPVPSFLQITTELFMIKMIVTLTFLLSSSLSMACQCTDEGLDEYDVAEALTSNASLVGDVDVSSIEVLSNEVRENQLLLLHGLLKYNLAPEEDKCAVDCSYGRRFVANVKFKKNNSLKCSATLVKPARKLYKIEVKDYRCD